MRKDRTTEELRAAVLEVGSWYHKIDLGMGVVTPGLDALEPVWENIREVRKHLIYESKNVLDLASFDGMWAFEAEKLSAATVVATDCNYPAFHNFLFCKEQLGSKVIPYYNVSPYNLFERLDTHSQLLFGKQTPKHCIFDIVQHLGLLYHLRDPMYSLNQARSLVVNGGTLLLETVAVLDQEDSYMIFNGVPPDSGRIYDDITTWWIPTLTCLKEMLRASLFEPLEDSIKILRLPSNADRVSLIATAVSPESIDPDYFRELSRGYRNPGLVVNQLKR